MGPRKEDIEEANKAENKYTGDLVLERSCSDPLCCLIFLAAIIAMIGCGAMGIQQGNPAKLITPYDDRGNMCGNSTKQRDGVDGSFTDYKYKFFDGLISASTGDPRDIYNAVCVKKCPQQGEKSDCYITPGRSDCPYSVMDTNTNIAPTYCLPDVAVAKEQLTKIYRAMGNNPGYGKYLADLEMSGPAIGIMVAVTIVISIIYIYLLQLIVKPILYLSMLVVLALFAGGGAWAWMTAADFKVPEE